MRGGVRVTALLAALLAAIPVPVLATASPAYAASDVTGYILADRNITLSGDAVVNVPSGTTAYSGVPPTAPLPRPRPAGGDERLSHYSTRRAAARPAPTVMALTPYLASRTRPESRAVWLNLRRVGQVGRHRDVAAQQG